MRKSILLLALLLTATSGFSATCAELQKMKAVAYGFSPAKLSAEERKLKSKFLDEFWRAVENSRPDGATCLQSMLVAETQDKFFLYDGASLLYGLDESADSARVVVRALSATDLQDIDPVEFVNFTIRLAREGHDVLPLARKFLYEATGEVNVPQHALRLDHESVSMLLFGLMPPEQTEQVLVEALQDKRGTVRSGAVMSLAMALTPGSFKEISAVDRTSVTSDVGEDLKFVLARVPVKTEKAKYTREQVLTILRRMPRSRKEFEEAEKLEEVARNKGNGVSPEPFTDISSYDSVIDSGVLTLTADDLDEVRHIRVRAIHSLSDESLGEYFAYTKMIVGVINRLNLYSEYRSNSK